MEMIGEMVAKSGLSYLAQRPEAVLQHRALSREIKSQYIVLNRIGEDMQQALMSVRMLPRGAVFPQCS